MNFIINTLVYLLLLVFDVKTIVNDAERLENCVTRVGASITETSDSGKNLLKLIDQSTVILKAFCSENLISFAEENDDEFGVNAEKNPTSEKNGVNDVESDSNDDDYGDYYFYKSSDEKRIKILMTFTPITTYKGQLNLRQLESFNNQEFFLINGQLNATLELDKEEKILYQKKCFSNPQINDQGQMLNENHLIEQQLRYLLPGQLIIFGNLDNNNGQSKNHLVVKTSGIVRGGLNVESFVWNNLGWSGWGKWSPCSKSCKGIQQRYRHCRTSQQNKKSSQMATTDENQVNTVEKSESTRQPNQQLCNGYNIEQRECNFFECQDAVNLLSLANNTKASFKEMSAHINQVVDKNDFTIMLTIRSKVTRNSALHDNFGLNPHLMSLRSVHKQSSMTISLNENGVKVVQEKDSTSEMFDVKLDLFDLHWHQIAFSFRSDGLITCYVDCNWENSFVMPKGSFELPPNARLELDSKSNEIIEWNQLSLIPGNHERSQCSNERTPIYDNNKLLERMFNDEAN